LVLLILAVAASADFAAASQAHCLSIFKILRSKLLSLDTWSGDYEFVLDNLHNAYMPEVERVAATIEPTIIKMEQKYVSLIDSKSENSALAIESIRNCTRDGIENIDELFQLVGQKLEQSYHDNVHSFAMIQHTPDDLKDALLLPIYTIKTDFVRDCKKGFNLIQDGVDGVRDTMHRIHETFNTEPDQIDVVPENYVPIIEPMMLSGYFDDFIDMKAKGEAKNYPQHLMANSTEVFLSMYDNVNGQISDTKDSVETFLNTTTTIVDDDMRLHLVYKIRDKASDSQTEINGLLHRAQDDIKNNIPEFYEDGPEKMSNWAMATVCQETLEGFAHKANEIAEETINDFINLFEFFLDIAS